MKDSSMTTLTCVAKVLALTLLWGGAIILSKTSSASEYNPVEKNCSSGYLTIETGNFNIPALKKCLSEGYEVVTLQPGTRFSITFPDNPTTGMVWGLTKMPSHVMLITAEHISSPECSGEMVGCNGEFTYSFKAINPGDGEFVFAHGKIWENNTSPSRKMGLTIKGISLP